MAAGPGNGHFAVQQDGASRDFAAVNALVGFVVRAERGTFQGDAGEKPAGPGVTENFGFHPEIGVGGSIAAFGAGSGGGVPTEFDLAAENGSHAFLVHDQKNQIGGFAANLHAEAIALEGVHGGSTPRSVEFLAGAANHSAASVVLAHTEGQLQYRGEHDDTFSLGQDLLGQIVRDVQDLLHDDTAIFEALLFFGGGVKHARS